jgi:hypothetical protein
MASINVTSVYSQVCARACPHIVAAADPIVYFSHRSITLMTQLATVLVNQLAVAAFDGAVNVAALLQCKCNGPTFSTAFLTNSGVICRRTCCCSGHITTILLRSLAACFKIRQTFDV